MIAFVINTTLLLGKVQESIIILLSCQWDTLAYFISEWGWRWTNNTHRLFNIWKSNLENRPHQTVFIYQDLLHNISGKGGNGLTHESCLMFTGSVVVLLVHVNVIYQLSCHSIHFRYIFYLSTLYAEGEIISLGVAKCPSSHERS